MQEGRVLKSTGRGWTIAEKVVWLVIGAAISILITEPVKQRWNTFWINRRIPEVLLKEAEVKRAKLTEADLNSASDDYKRLLAGPKKYEAQACVGLSRTCFEMASIRYWRGFGLSDYPDQAVSYARRAIDAAPQDFDAALALAYAYYSVEAWQRDKPPKKDDELLSTRKLLAEAFAKKKDSPDAEYLAWLTKDQAYKDFPDEQRPDNISSLLMLIDIGMHYAQLARQAAPGEKQRYLDLAERFMARAESLSKDNTIVLFIRGYMSAATENTAKAQIYYKKAIDQEPNFPRAWNNLGYTYAAEGNYREAIRNFEAALQSENLPTSQLWVRLNNLGSAYLETKEDGKACSAWISASQSPGAREWRVSYWLAACDYISEKKESASSHFRRAVQLAKEGGSDLTDISSFEKEKAGPRELGIAKALIQMIKKQ